MPLLKICSEIGYASEFLETDYRGEYVQKEKSGGYNVAVPVDLRDDGYTVNVGTFFEGRILVSQFENDGRREVLNGAATAVALAAFEQIGRANHLEVYKRNKVYIDSKARVMAAADAPPLNTDLEVSSSLYTLLRDATERNKLAEVAFEKAKRYLQRELGGVLSYDASRVRSAAHYLAQCMAGADGGFLDASNREKASGLIREIEDMIRRKNPGHPNFRRAADRAYSNLYCLHFPRHLSTYPPPPSMLQID
jgi:hypothetical protein